MTLDYSWQEQDSQDQRMPQRGEMPEHPVHVKVTNTQTERVAPEYTAWQSFTVASAGSQPTQLCPHRYHRYKAKMIWTIPASTTVYLASKPDPISVPSPPPTIASLTGPLTAWSMPDYDGMEPVYAVCGGGGDAATVTVIDESYGTVQ